jgi:hypothetical protein
VELDERAAEARAIVNSPMFKESVDALKDRYTTNLCVLEVGTPQAISVHAKLRVLGDLVAEINTVITDQQMHRKTKHGN